MPANLIVLPKLVEHRIAMSENDEIEAALFEYLLAGNGLFVRARRREFSVTLPLCREKVSGLPNASAGIVWNKPKVPSALWRAILHHGQQTQSSASFKEEIYLIYWSDILSQWKCRASGRERSWASTLADDSLAEYTECCIELHTHPPGALSFSVADDRDELGKFRIFAILIDAFGKPKIRFRCGVYDHLIPIPAAWIGEMPDELADLTEIDALVEALT